MPKIIKMIIRNIDTFPKLGRLLIKVFTRFLSVSILVIFLSGCKTLKTLSDFRFVTLVRISIILKII